MKFRFCGDLDVPDFLLADVSLLSKISSVRLKLVCTQVLNSLFGTEINFEKVAKLTADANFDAGDIKACIHSLRFVFTSAAKYATEPPALVEELAMLGFPKEHCEAIGRSYRDGKDRLREVLIEQSLSLPRLEKTDWRVDYLLGSRDCESLGAISVHLRLKSSNDGIVRYDAIELTSDKFRVLYNELKEARAALEKMAGTTASQT